MLRSLFTGISGLSAHQEMLDVTANNIANVNTTGFKSSSVQFEDTLSQTMSTGGGGVVGTTTPAVNPAGGTNPQQVGLGVQVAGTELNFTQGSNQQTGEKTNMLINGDGFFAVQKNGTTYFTRNGAFLPDAAGHLVTPDGAMLMGWASGVAHTPANLTPIQLPLTSVTDPTTGAAVYTGADAWTDFSIGPDGTITGVDASGKPITASTDPTRNPITLAVETFANPGGLQKAGDSLYLQTPSSEADTPLAKTNITTGYVEMSNVDLARELSNLIIAERGFQANSKTISTSDQVLQTLVNMVQ